MLVSTFFRNLVNVPNNVPIVPVDQDQEIKITGKRGGTFTRGGTRILHPTTYAKSGWSNMVYKTDTRKIEVPSAIFIRLSAIFNKTSEKKHKDVAERFNKFFAKTRKRPIKAFKKFLT